MARRTSKPRDVDQPRAIATGLFAALVVGLLLSGLAQPLGLEQLDSPPVLGAYIARAVNLPEGIVALALGWSLVGVWGAACSLIFARYFSDRLVGPGWLQGMIYSGAVLFVISLLFRAGIHWARSVATLPLDLFD